MLLLRRVYFVLFWRSLSAHNTQTLRQIYFYIFYKTDIFYCCDTLIDFVIILEWIWTHSAEKNINLVLPICNIKLQIFTRHVRKDSSKNADLRLVERTAVYRSVWLLQLGPDISRGSPLKMARSVLFYFIFVKLWSPVASRLPLAIKTYFVVNGNEWPPEITSVSNRNVWWLPRFCPPG